MRRCTRIFQTLMILTMVLTGAMIHAQERPPARVVVTHITFQTVAPNQSFIGTLYYERESQVSSDVSGLVTRMNVKQGDHVSKDAALIHLDTELLEKDILIQKTRIDQTQLEQAHLEKNHQRMAALYKSDGVREKDLDDATFLFQDARLRLQTAKTALEKLLIQKRKSIIYAPFEGIVLEKNVDVGDWIQQGKPLVRIGSVNDLYIKVAVAETMLKHIIVGQTVPVTIVAYDEDITGTIDSVSPIADIKTKNIFLKIKIPQVERVAQNMSARVFLPTGTTQKLMMIPRDALVRPQGSDAVYTVQDGKAALLPVTIVTYLGNLIGADNDHFKDGMPIVVEGNERLQQGQPVTIAGEK